MPRQKPGESKQDYGTPRVFLDAVEKRFGKIAFDLAAHKKNDVTRRGFYFGPGSMYAEDSLAQDWRRAPTGVLWLNPPFSHIKPWAKKCSESYPPPRWDLQGLSPKRKILFLVPASVGANWFWEYVQPYSLVIPLSPRLAFDGQPVNPVTGKIDPYPKDLMLCCYGYGPGVERWVWQ